MNEQPAKAEDSEILQILTTEHYNLQAARSATTFEANGRTNLFLGAVSSSVVALAFIGQISEMNRAFFLFALILLPSLIFLGLVTFIRVDQTGTEDMIASRGINHIRHYYAETAPSSDLLPLAVNQRCSHPGHRACPTTSVRQAPLPGRDRLSARARLALAPQRKRQDDCYRSLLMGVPYC